MARTWLFVSLIRCFRSAFAGVPESKSARKLRRLCFAGFYVSLIFFVVFGFIYLFAGFLRSVLENTFCYLQLKRQLEHPPNALFGLV